jgi:GT2 family glycosyltransferase
MAEISKRDFVSIIITSYIPNNERAVFMRESISSLIENTNYPYQLIVVDNGGSMRESEWLLSKADEGEIHVYIRNGTNMHFGYARNQGLKLAHGGYICIADNDIKYKKGWLTECVAVLEGNPNHKIYATPFAYPTTAMNKRYHQGFLEFKDKEYELNMRAGSNCFVVKREDFRAIGGFGAHRIAGSHWTDTATKKGYLACVVPGQYAVDQGLRKGYNLGESIPIKLKMKGKSIYFNQDEYKKRHSEKEFLNDTFDSVI